MKSNSKKSEPNEAMEIIQAIDILEKEKGIDKETMFVAVENSLIKACESHFGKGDNYIAKIDRETGVYKIAIKKTVVENVENELTEISLSNAKVMNLKYEIGDIVEIPVNSKDFGRIIAQNAKSTITQAIREAERKSKLDFYSEKQGEIVTGIVQRINENGNISINIGKIDTVLTVKEQVEGEVFKPTERIKLYVVDVRDANGHGPRVTVSRTHPELVKRLFENEVAEVRDGSVVITSVAREAGSRSKIAVKSTIENIDPVGSCVGVNGARVNSIVNELRGEKIDIVNWSENPAEFIENALSPSKVISVIADDENKIANVVVPDYQLSLAIGKEGQNARLAAKLTGFKIDIKSESQAQAQKESAETEETEETVESEE